ncbi:hypothetical protein DM860_007111 [Cuscuta australis]|uniref:Uncharacterized protein n=1 Tax=Cuscuta australis TaxID=267555 RepID=A0A328EA06_9ASTE|nr:hypothetical protein DM860_007111 [Cuscuta australis]
MHLSVFPKAPSNNTRGNETKTALKGHARQTEIQLLLCVRERQTVVKDLPSKKSSIQCSGSRDFHHDIVRDLQDLLNEHNSLAKSFRMASEHITDRDGKHSNVRLKLVGRRQNDARTYRAK